MESHSTDKAILVALVLATMLAAFYTSEAKLYDAFLIGLGVVLNKIGSRVESK